MHSSNPSKSPGIGPVPPAPEVVKQAEALSDILPELLANQEANEPDYIDTLPRNVQRRIQALKKLQFQYNEVEGEFMKEISRLEQQYQDKFHPILQKRSAIITGKVEPTDEEVRMLLFTMITLFFYSIYKL
ncbi:Nucleosome assembly protein 1-like 1 [Oopsacas minuta]|uniref:Nucleosome assembly protein 1-like 1 n=1 Tax=Oopsacas minuta TaxID=111878 RepID=A0AAV7JIC0_9METZ|nr:Nucleosome assembly protein 1-like 1 [Oopsacas minuta]